MNVWQVLWILDIFVLIGAAGYLFYKGMQAMLDLHGN